jgi:hypothetical protein
LATVTQPETVTDVPSPEARASEIRIGSSASLFMAKAYAGIKESTRIGINEIKSNENAEFAKHLSCFRKQKSVEKL